jgi:hypothetical protein
MYYYSIPFYELIFHYTNNTTFDYSFIGIWAVVTFWIYNIYYMLYNNDAMNMHICFHLFIYLRLYIPKNGITEL